MKQSMSEGKDAIDAMLEYLVTTTEVDIDKNHKIKKHTARKEKGWIVPHVAGYHWLLRRMHRGQRHNGHFSDVHNNL
jgi:adenosyl cobinamide kinase/adenosyl cobinamide phosphate guanylyltransferase